jgi:LasA protease
MGVGFFWGNTGLMPLRDNVMNGRTCVTSNFVMLTCLGLAAINTNVTASEINQPEFNYSAHDMQRLLPASGDVLFSNALFLYGRDAEAFDLAGYLAVYAPVLRDKQELIAHWSGYYSISPKVVLALMELKTGLLSAPSQEKLQAPFAELSNASGFCRTTARCFAAAITAFLWL